MRKPMFRRSAEEVKSFPKKSVSINRKASKVRAKVIKREAGTGYWIEFEIDLDSIGDIKVNKVIKKPETDIHDLGYFYHEQVIPFEIETEIPAKIDINSANSYMYGIEAPLEGVQAVITKVKGVAPADKTDEYYWDIDDPEQVKNILFR